EAAVGEVDAVDLDLGRLLVEQVVELLLGVLADRLVRVEEAAAAEDPAVPAIHGVAGDRQRAVVERLLVVVQLREVDVADLAGALAARAHAAGLAEDALLGLAAAALLDRDLADGADGRDVEGEGVGRADVRLAEAAP